MFALAYILGIITGIVLAVLVAVILKRNEVVIVRKLLQANAKLVSKKEKAEFFEPTSEAEEAIAEVIKENDERGVDTEVKNL